MSEQPQPHSPTQPPREPLLGFKARYISGGTELASNTQGRLFVRDRQITIGVVQHLLAVEAEQKEVRAELRAKDGIPLTQHAALVGRVFTGVVARMGADFEITSAETLLSEYELAATAVLRDALEQALEDRDRQRGEVLRTFHELELARSRIRELDQMLADSDITRLRNALAEAEAKRDETRTQAVEAVEAARLANEGRERALVRVAELEQLLAEARALAPSPDASESAEPVRGEPVRGEPVRGRKKKPAVG